MSIDGRQIENSTPFAAEILSIKILRESTYLSVKNKGITVSYLLHRIKGPYIRKCIAV